jgi:hypothetical protein
MKPFMEPSAQKRPPDGVALDTEANPPSSLRREVTAPLERPLAAKAQRVGKGSGLAQMQDLTLAPPQTPLVRAGSLALAAVRMRCERADHAGAGAIVDAVEPTGPGRCRV